MLLFVTREKAPDIFDQFQREKDNEKLEIPMNRFEVCCFWTHIIEKHMQFQHKREWESNDPYVTHFKNSQKHPGKLSEVTNVFKPPLDFQKHFPVMTGMSVNK